MIRLLEKDATMSILCVLWQKSAERSISALNALSDESIDFFLQHDGYSSQSVHSHSSIKIPWNTDVVLYDTYD